MTGEYDLHNLREVQVELSQERLIARVEFKRCRILGICTPLLEKQYQNTRALSLVDGRTLDRVVWTGRDFLWIDSITNQYMSYASVGEMYKAIQEFLKQQEILKQVSRGRRIRANLAQEI